jgi:hypothetical protein
MKSQRIKIHGLCYRFSIYLKSMSLDMVLVLEITNIWQKSWDFFGFQNFFLDIFKIHRLVWNFLRVCGVLNVFCQYFVLSYY